MQSTSWLNLSRAKRREIEQTAARGPTETEARAPKAQRMEERRRAKAAGQKYDPLDVVVTFNGQVFDPGHAEIRID